jgi:hypothetical protein
VHAIYQPFQAAQRRAQRTVYINFVSFRNQANVLTCTVTSYSLKCFRHPKSKGFWARKPFERCGHENEHTLFILDHNLVHRAAPRTPCWILSCGAISSGGAKCKFHTPNGGMTTSNRAINLMLSLYSMRQYAGNGLACASHCLCRGGRWLAKHNK